jgi:thiol-disulfide isomerase/thioredoxin
MHPILRNLFTLLVASTCCAQTPPASQSAESRALADEVSRLEDDFLATVEGASDLPTVFDAYEANMKRLIAQNPGRPEPFAGMTELFEKCEPRRTIRILDDCLGRADLPEKVRVSYEALHKTANLVGSSIDLAFTSVDGRRVQFDKLRGKVVVIDFWATWCGPCVRDLPKLEAMHRKHEANGLVIVGISFDRERSKLESFLKARQIPWAQVYPSKDEQERILRSLGVSGGYLPTVFILGRDGRLRHTLNSRFRIEDKVTALLGEK